MTRHPNSFGAIFTRLAVMSFAVAGLAAPAPGANAPQAPAHGLTVAEGCETPKSNPAGRIFYVDPVHGDMANDGSMQRPWRTLAEVTDEKRGLISSMTIDDYAKGSRALKPFNPGGVIRPGDTLALMSGDHGDVVIRRFLNSDFIKVVAGPGQTPLIRSMKVMSTTRWVFQGLKFQGVRPANDKWGKLVEVIDNNYFGPGGNIVFSGNSFSTEDNATAWKDVDWVEKPYLLALSTQTRCTALFNNHFYNVRNAIFLGASDSVASDNLIEDFGNDAVEHAASNTTISRNLIRNGRHTPAEPLHPDAIQGWTVGGATNRNVLIDSNRILDATQSDDRGLQGIGIFDGDWDGVRIVNNLVVVNHWHGITLMGIRNGVVVNNSVIPARPAKRLTWITIDEGKGHDRTSHVVVRNNIAGQIVAGGDEISVDHNLTMGRINLDKVRNSSREASADPSNVQDVPMDLALANVDVPAHRFDFHLASRSLAAKAGSSRLAPAVDIEGRRRTAPIDIGAFAR